VNTDDNIEGHDPLTAQIEAQIEDGLSRFGDQISRVEVHLSDENAEKSGGNDNRCLLEVRLKGQSPVAVTHKSGSPQEACAGAVQKMMSKLQSTLGRQNSAKGGHSIRDLDPL
jgi:ribosome-associated translation inhibitor RaiA